MTANEKMTPEQAAQRVKDGDDVLLTVRAVADDGAYWLCQSIVPVEVIQSVEIVPPEAQPGEWWLVESRPAELVGRCVMLRTDIGWARDVGGLSYRSAAIAPLRRMTFANDRDSP